MAKKNRLEAALEKPKQVRKTFRGPTGTWDRLAKLKRAKKAKSLNAMIVALINTVCDAEGIEA